MNFAYDPHAPARIAILKAWLATLKGPKRDRPVLVCSIVPYRMYNPREYPPVYRLVLK